MKKKKKGKPACEAAEAEVPEVDAPADLRGKKRKVATETTEQVPEPAVSKKRKTKASAAETKDSGPAAPRPYSATTGGKGKVAAQSPAVASKPAPTGADAPAKNGVAPDTVFVDGLPYDWTEDKIRELFKDFQVSSIRAPTWQDSGRLRGFCHAQLADAKAAKSAVAKLHNYVLPVKKGRFLKVMIAKAAKEGPGAGQERTALGKHDRTLFVKGLPYSAVEAEIAALFKGAKAVRIAHNQGRSKGFAYIDFVDRKTAQAALDKSDGYTMGGRRLLVDAATGQARSGYHHPSSAYDAGLHTRSAPPPKKPGGPPKKLNLFA